MGDSDRMSSNDDFMTVKGARSRQQEGHFQVGELIMNRYKVLAELGQGGMGVVYRCLDETAGIQVALKALPPELSHNTIEMEDIKDNFQLVSKLVHQNIAISKNLEKDDSNGNYYLIMECVEGEDLRRWLKRKRRENTLEFSDVISIIRQAADALDYAHSQMIIHRDIKPGNIMIDQAGRIKVLDFGLAAQIHTSMSRVSMAYQGTSGTGPYMAPEQWRGRAQGAAADQYSLAVMAYEILAGNLPFESADPAVLKQAVLDETPEKISNIPPASQSAIMRAMSKLPADRFASCADFAAALAGEKIKKSPTSKPAASGKSLKLPVIFTILALLIAGAAGYYGFDRYRKEQIRLEQIANLQQKISLARDKSQWEEVLQYAGEIIQLDAGNSEAVQLKKEAEKQIAEIRRLAEEKRIREQIRYEQEMRRKAELGYEIVTENGQKRAVWHGGKTHPQNNYLVADVREGQWISTRPGYIWKSGTSTLWQAGLTHPDNPDLQSASTPDQWVATKPGYVWTGGTSIEWRSGQTSSKYPHCVSSQKVGSWHPQEGYRWSKPDQAGNFEVQWAPGKISGDGTRKASDTEGVWLKKVSCTPCGGNGKISSSTLCAQCNGSGEIKDSTSCLSCDGSGSRSRSNRCSSCSGNGIITVNCGECGVINDRFGNILSHHGQICDNCRGSGGTRYQGTGNVGYDIGYQLGMALTGQHAVKCRKCNGFGWYHHSTCNRSGVISKNCSDCNGSGRRSSTSQCWQCNGSGRKNTTRSCSCSNGRINSSSQCIQCSGNGYIWR